MNVILLKAFCFVLLIGYIYGKCDILSNLYSCHKCSLTGQLCGSNMVWKECGSLCEPTCATVNRTEPVFCPMICLSGCFCESPYVLNKNSNECVLARNC